LPYLRPGSIGRLAEAYPGKPAVLGHSLVGHILLDLEVLGRAALRMDPAHVERRMPPSRNGAEFAMAPGDDQPIDSVIRDIRHSGNWVMLRVIEQLPEYEALLHGLLEEVGPAIAPNTGRHRDIRGFLFISAPGTLTPFHFDAEYNILFQIAGDKQFATYGFGPPFITPEKQEAYHQDGENLLAWRKEFADAGQVHGLFPGDALYVPYGAPHWVKVGTQPSISLSVTWQTDWSRHHADAHLLNGALRRKGLPLPPPPPAWPESSAWRSRLYRVAHKASLL